VVSGFWHGASFNFGMWGLAHALLLIAEYYLFDKIGYHKLPNWIKVVFVFLVVNFTFLIFKITDNYAIIDIVQHFFNNLHFGLSAYRFEWYIIVYSLPVFLYHYYGSLNDDQKARWTKAKPIIFALFLILLINNSGPMGEFIYFQF
jgi:D-alanyl-lipoteichoic acid acyltransferase DltB (MBOAT superfamily)